MAPSLLLPPEEPHEFLPKPVKQAPKPNSVEGAISLDNHAPVGGHFSFQSSFPSVNGHGQGGATNGFAGSTGFSGHQADRRDFVTSQALLEQSMNFASGHSSAEGAAKKPNILYIMADQMAAPLLKMNDPDSVIKTPNLDELAKNGVVFSSAYCNSPLCAPSRFTMCSGQLPSKIGGYDNAAVLGPEVPTYAHYLRREGYETALAGKMHFIGPDQLHGFEHR